MKRAKRSTSSKSHSTSKTTENVVNTRGDLSEEDVSAISRNIGRSKAKQFIAQGNWKTIKLVARRGKQRK